MTDKDSTPHGRAPDDGTLRNASGLIRARRFTQENQREADALKALWQAYRDEMTRKGVPYESQEEFGLKYDIGNQSAVGFFLNGKAALSMKAARGFARGLGCQIGDFSPRLEAEAATLLQVAGFQADSAGRGQSIDLAHALSEQTDTLRPQLVIWEDLVQESVKLPAEFRVAMPDDAMGSRAPKGCVLTFSTTEKPRYGDGILVRTRDGETFFRLYQQGLDGWEARAINPAFVTLKSVDHGLQIIAVMMEGGPRWG